MGQMFDKEQYLAELRADIADQRLTLTRLVDEVHDAFHRAGGTSEEYVQTQFFQGMLFRAVQNIPEGTSEKRAAFKVCLIFMCSLKQYYIDMAKDPDWIKAHALRKT